MRFQTPLVPGTLIRRYKRFLADVLLPDGREVVAHCPNPGSMMGLKDAGLRVWLEANDDPRKKLKFGWRVVEMPDGTCCGIDTSLTNKVVAEALMARIIPELSHFDLLRPEVGYGTKSRVDFLLTGADILETYVEVKSVTLSRVSGQAEFPDSVTARGAKHLRELALMVEQGHRAVMLFVVQRTDCEDFRLAGDLDPAYARAFDAAQAAGVEMLCYGADVSPQAIILGSRIPFHPLDT